MRVLPGFGVSRSRRSGLRQAQAALFSGRAEAAWTRRDLYLSEAAGMILLSRVRTPQSTPRQPRSNRLRTVPTNLSNGNVLAASALTSEKFSLT
ncbi:hypothetical protein, partial [Paraburkholderia sp. UCT31]|uniref:hypothetical protein n=1 Tax=Paraburkholderia sp. UCT31 TaxID=2615209 RepID=UPI001CA445DC